jgi:hypothetical protein
MTDSLVRALNNLGYQPVFLPRTNVLPPEVYAYSRQNRRLVRHGPLKDYLKSSPDVKLTQGQLADIQYVYTSSKNVDATLKFLETALNCIGITGAPQLDLKFAGAKDFSFAFTGVNFESLDPSSLKNLIPEFDTKGIPQEYVDEGQLHVAYEYAYASELLMSRGDKKDFAADVGANIADYIKVGASGSVKVASKSTLSFKNTAGAAAAFAYKAGRLTREGKNWVFNPEVVSTGNLLGKPSAFVPQVGIVLTADSKS